ncbi:uncharacterized protein LOC126855821 isoform X2 [Cataglyphis hispanica]|uniref:uncharacterized protein LOC126855821 isoform X2 n=1 Tax=Cataglyphis hispanica TaxID=1086592 RepID=UPI00217FB259|nr:uncharacterized protein LOC126855821 isoform X2 [Cataglyphis hispanica]
MAARAQPARTLAMAIRKPAGTTTCPPRVEAPRRDARCAAHWGKSRRRTRMTASRRTIPMWKRSGRTARSLLPVKSPRLTNADGRRIRKRPRRPARWTSPASNTSKGNRQFLVRWKGYGESADTWENEKDLNCPQLIEKFLANEEEQETKSIKTGSTKTDKSKKSKASPKKQNENDEQNNKDDKETLKEFEVEKIIEVRFKKNGTKEFLIRWKGFSPADDTWEPEKNLNCSELIAKFMQKVEKAKTQEMRELRTNRVHTKRYTLSTCDHGRRLSKRNKDKQRTTYHECDE